MRRRKDFGFSNQCIIQATQDKSLATAIRKNTLCRTRHPHFFFEDCRFRATENFRVFQPNAREHNQFAIGNGSAIQATAHARFQDSHIDVLFSVIEECDNRQNFKERRFHLRFFGCRLDLHNQAVERFIINRQIVHADAFTHTHQMRACIKPRLEAVRLQNTRQVIARRALAVRANNMNRLKLFLRISESFAKFTGRSKTRHHPEYEAGIQIFQSVLNHGQ